jgi:hypothetical protein
MLPFASRFLEPGLSCSCPYSAAASMALFLSVSLSPRGTTPFPLCAEMARLSHRHREVYEQVEEGGV